jgi:hypothetical protein
VSPGVGRIANPAYKTPPHKGDHHGDSQRAIIEPFTMDNKMQKELLNANAAKK